MKHHRNGKNFNTYSYVIMMKPLFPPSERLEQAKDLASHERKPDEILNSNTLNAWNLIKAKLTDSLSEDVIIAYIHPLEVKQVDLETLEIKTDKAEVYEELTNSLLGLINTTKEELGLGFIKTHLLLVEKKAASFEEQSRKPEQMLKSAQESKENTEEAKGASSVFSKKLSKIPKLNPSYLFESFVKGPSNQFALATCQNIADAPGSNYNPLFLYGSTGLGKTHLLHAVGNHVRKTFPDMVVTYISSERFMNEMIYCIRHNKMWDFRQKYRHCDVFMMDDIQFISGNKSATQEEFFHTFNSLHEAKKQIIITSDLFPQDIPDIEERLRNRFQWGLIADIQPPDVEHRIAILISKAEKMGISLNPDVAEFIANHAKRNIRELEGALHRLAAFAALQGRSLDLQLALETFQAMPTESSKRLDVELVLKTVAEHFKLKVTDLKSKKRQRAITIPRQIAMYLARNYTNSSYPDIGSKIGGRDHTTVMHAFNKIKKSKATSPDLKSHLESIERLLDQKY